MTEQEIEKYLVGAPKVQSADEKAANAVRVADMKKKIAEMRNCAALEEWAFGDNPAFNEVVPNFEMMLGAVVELITVFRALRGDVTP